MNNLTQLKDIKPIVEVVDYSLYTLILSILVGLCIVGYILYKYFTKITKTKQPTQKEKALQRLKNIDFNNTKEAVYRFCLDCEYFLNDNNKQQFDNIVNQLEEYKYKKDINPLNDDTIHQMKQFIKELR